ncbi:MAG: outer membrane protein transport protein [Actinobacteria bacterium]|nr:outer membrane protein transport protein [Actinomycetota bacterium]
MTKFRRATLGGLALAAALAVAPAAAYGAGFSLQDHDAKALGLSNAFVATADNPSAIFYNPSGMHVLDGMHGSANVVVIAPRLDYDPDPGEGEDAELRNKPAVIPALFGTVQLGEFFHFGLGSFTPFGLATKYPRFWAGRYISIEAEIQTIVLNPNLVFHIPIGDEHVFAIGGGMEVMYGSVLLKRAIDFRFLGEPDGYVNLYGDTETLSLGWNVSAMITLFDRKVRFGGGFRSDHANEVGGELKIRGRAEFINTPALAGLPRATSARADIPLPSTAAAGVAVEPIDGLTLEADFRFQKWSVLDEVTLRVKHRPDTKIFFEWHDAIAIAGGVEYKLIKDQEKETLNELAVRIGTFWDQTPVNRDTFSPTVPDHDRYGGSVGVGVKLMDMFSADFAYLFVYLDNPDKENVNGAENGGTANGTYSATAHLFAITLGMHF